MQKIFDYQSFVFDYEPFPTAVAKQFVEPTLYASLVREFPSLEIFGSFPDGYSHKKRLSETNELEQYRAFIVSSPAYRTLYEYFKSKEFILDVLNCFEENNIKLRLFDAPVSSSTAPLRGQTYVWLENTLRKLRLGKSLSARFEFSALPPDGGSIRPHTDAPAKIITLVISILEEGEWKEEWGGGTDILKPKDPRKSYNFYNTYLDFDECEILKTVPYTPNQCMLFLKTYNSLHSVRPIKNLGQQIYRKTLTVNIEWV